MNNILSNHLSDDFVDDLDWKAAHAFGLLWMLIHRKLPDELSDDLVTWLTETGIYHMNKDAVQGFQEQIDVRLSWILVVILSTFNGLNLPLLQE